jgi:hypothetical protein
LKEPIARAARRFAPRKIPERTQPRGPPVCAAQNRDISLNTTTVSP